jgi:hypothetical protein
MLSITCSLPRKHPIIKEFMYTEKLEHSSEAQIVFG